MSLTEESSGQSLAEKAYEEIKKAIYNLEILPGASLVEAQFSARLGISRTPLRAAIARLEREGLLVRIPNKGAIVAPVEIREVHEVFELRELLETKALEEAFLHADQEWLKEFGARLRELEPVAENKADECMTMDERFHMFITTTAGNRWVIRIMRELLNKSVIMRAISANSYGRSRQTVVEFIALIDAWLGGDKEGALELLRNHIRNAKADVLNRN